MSSPTPPPDEKKVTVNAPNSRGLVIGDFANVVQNYLADPRLRWYVIGVGVLVIAAAVALYFAITSSQRKAIVDIILPTASPTPKFMSGNINVAVAGYTLVPAENAGTSAGNAAPAPAEYAGTSAGNAAPADPLLGRKLAENLYRNLDESLRQLQNAGALDLPQVWGPDQIEPVAGDTPEARAHNAAQIAERYHVHILIYGTVTTGDPLQVTPEFYISPKDFYDATEITGPYRLGVPFSLQGEPLSAPFNALLNRNMSPRLQTLALLIQGLSYYVTRDFDRALDVLQTAAPLDPAAGKKLPAEGREVVYLLAGNAAQKDGKYDVAEQYYNLSLQEDPQYARPMIGKASVFYLRALQKFNQSKQAGDIDGALLQQSLGLYREAAAAGHRPAEADIDTKVHFGTGQCLYYLVYTGREPFFDPAIAEFQSVIAAYDGGDPATQNRIRDMAGYAHGHLGLIYEQADRKDLARAEYLQAAELLKTSFDQERRKWYAARAETLK